ncbi:MAG: outer membrane beta-barrel protein [Alistipes sp.]|nr:outer membrane beta-barrel protein [Alistipes sp.]
MKRFFKITALMLFALACHIGRAEAQHVVAVTTGAGMATSRIYPAQETRPIWGTWQAGVSWRYYSLPRFVGGVGIDLDWMQRGFSYAPYASIYEDKKDYKYYRRNVNTMMLPVVWQPHVYMFKNHLRIYLEAAVTFSYNFASSFENHERYTFGSQMSSGVEVIKGKYHMRTERDNRFGYGLAGGGGLDLLFNQIEVGVRVRYDFGFSDILKNRNKYYDNKLDQELYPGENPFWYTPLRSPLDNLTISLRVGFRFNKAGFDEWFYKPTKKNKEVIKFAL